MKIILIIPSLNHGGAERVMSLLANQWAILDHEIHLVILVKSQHFYTISEKVNVHELNFINTGKTGKIINGIKTFIKLRRLT